ncbi:Pre-mRNA-splicing factor SYF2 [Coemansia spiralis]|nr:Pre-mRNA-splicing factor SYF2 [Coemansia spiralis]
MSKPPGEEADKLASDAGDDEQQTHTASESSGESSSDSEPDITHRDDIPKSLRPRVDRLKALRERLAKSSQDNKRDLYKEHQRQRENPGEEQRQERKRREAQKLQLKDEYAGGDYERSRFWDYSVEQVEQYEGKRQRREDNRERGFTDYSQVNQRKYERDVAKLKPDLAAYQRAKDETPADTQHQPDSRSVAALARSVEDQQKRRATLHKPSIAEEGEQVSYINQRNARFNRKMNRAYDKHTKEIRDNFERGTAL